MVGYPAWLPANSLHTACPQNWMNFYIQETAFKLWIGMAMGTLICWLQRHRGPFAVWASGKWPSYPKSQCNTISQNRNSQIKFQSQCTRCSRMDRSKLSRHWLGQRWWSGPFSFQSWSHTQLLGECWGRAHSRYQQSQPFPESYGHLHLASAWLGWRWWFGPLAWHTFRLLCRQSRTRRAACGPAVSTAARSWRSLPGNSCQVLGIFPGCWLGWWFRYRLAPVLNGLVV